MTVAAPLTPDFSFWPDLLTVAVAHLLAVASPGPDLAIITHLSLRHGRQAARWAAWGIGTGILVHCAYAVAGLGWLMREGAALTAIIQVLGALYLLYLGVLGMRARPQPLTPEPEAPGGLTVQIFRAGRAFRTGFLTNVLNPKATLFFLALFTVVVSPATPTAVLLIYALWLSLATALWFLLVGHLLSHPKLQRRLTSSAHWIDRSMGLILILLGLKLLADGYTTLAAA